MYKRQEWLSSINQQRASAAQDEERREPFQDIDYSVENIVNNVVIAIYRARWALEVLGRTMH